MLTGLTGRYASKFIDRRGVAVIPRAAVRSEELWGPPSADRPHRDHDPRRDVTKDLPSDDPGPRELRRLLVGLHEVHRDPAVARPQHPGRDLDNP